jgi:hypothetical protein
MKDIWEELAIEYLKREFYICKDPCSNYDCFII